MISEDKIAAATLAQIFGSELTSIDKSITHKSANTPNATKLSPKEILMGSQQQGNDQQRISQLQNEAENAFPYQPGMVQQAPPIQQIPNTPLPVSPQAGQFIAEHNSNQNLYLERICIALEKIAIRFEKSEILLKPPFRSRTDNK